MRSLVVDDEFVALTRMSAMLGRYGRCDAATHGSQAVEMYRAAVKEGFYYSLVTIDIDMPEMSGIRLLKALRDVDADLDIVPAKKIIVSATSSSDMVRMAAESHCDGYLVKPVRTEVLDRKLREIGLVQNQTCPSSPSGL